jgi:hypothetical protein
MLIIVVAVGAAIALLLVAILVSAQTIAPYALAAAVVAIVIGLLVKTPPGLATTKKWLGLAAAVAVLMLAILLITAGAFVSKNMAPGQAYVAKLAEIEAIFAQPDRTDWLPASRRVAMSLKNEDSRKQLNYRILTQVSGIHPSREFSPSDVALAEVIYGEQHGSLEDGQKVISCHAQSARIILAKTSPADVYDVLQRYSTADPYCQGRLIYQTLVNRACSDKTSRWGKRCADELPKEKLATLISGSDRYLSESIEQLLRQ